MIEGLDVLRRRIATKSAPSREGDCVVFVGAHSQSGGRGVFYPAVRISGVTYRVCRVLLLIDDLPARSPLDLGAAIAAASKGRKGFDASHRCDNSFCIRRSHLKWERHADNVRHQVERRRLLREAECE